MNGVLITDPDLWSRFLTGEAVQTFLLTEDSPKESDFEKVRVYFKKSTSIQEEAYIALVIKNYGYVKPTKKSTPYFLRILVKRLSEYI